MVSCCHLPTRPRLFQLKMMRTIVALGVLLLSSAPADAQYFGRNKVQYDRFAFSILQTPHFDIYYYASEHDAARIAAQLAERWYARLSVTLDHKFVADFLKVLKPEQQFQLEIENADAAALFSTDDGYAYVLMPLARDR